MRRMTPREPRPEVEMLDEVADFKKLVNPGLAKSYPRATSHVRAQTNTTLTLLWKIMTDDVGRVIVPPNRPRRRSWELVTQGRWTKREDQQHSDPCVEACPKHLTQQGAVLVATPGVGLCAEASPKGTRPCGDGL
mmetsp:Transcript_20221/g.22568  ORF Transcript_20221/g.22568 Transcript_20221/m.22568 type:complete len:135 (+) Transcript_20221:180-584(+)